MEQTINKETQTGNVTRRAFIATAFAALATSCGCKAWNENPNNKRFWFPTLCPPSREEQELRAMNFPEGGDPYVDAEVGPRSLATRPRGWDMQRPRTSTTAWEVSDRNTFGSLNHDD